MTRGADSAALDGAARDRRAADQVRVLLTRMGADNAALRRRLERAGHDVIELPTVALCALPLPASQTLTAALVGSVAVPAVAALAFTSPHAVRFFVDRAFSGSDPIARWQARGGVVGVVGDATAAALIGRGIEPDVVAEPAQGAVLAVDLVARLPVAAELAHPCAAHARPELREGLLAAGLRYTPWVCYANAAPAWPDARTLERAHTADVAYLAAPSAADRLLAWAPALRERALVCIGPTTAAHLLSGHGVHAAAVAQDPSLASVEAAIAAAISAAQSAPQAGATTPQELP